MKKNLFGFRKAFSKSDTVIELLTELHDKIDEAGDTMCLFYDMTNAFNDFSISLKKKLKTIRVNGVALQWKLRPT